MTRLNCRRHFLKLGLAGMGFHLSSMLAAAERSGGTAGSGPRMIFIWLGGAPSTIDMWDPKPEAPEMVRGEFATISSAIPGVVVSEHLPKCAQILDRATLIRSMHHSIPEHGPGAQYMLTGHLPSPATAYPSLGSVAAQMADSDHSIPPYLAFNNPPAAVAGYLGSSWNAFEFPDDEKGLPRGLSLADDQTPDVFATRVALRDTFDQRFDDYESDVTASSLKRIQKSAVQVLKGDAIRKALDLESEPQTLRERYGFRSRLGRNVLQARRLVEAGARFVTVGFNGWDTHSDNFVQLRNVLLPQLDAALGTLISDLDERGMLKETVVCCCGEFGRTPQVNGLKGRDHWSRAFSVFLAGRGFQPGKIHGATDDQGGEPNADACTPADLFATLLDTLGVDLKNTLTTPSGRPMQLVKGAQVIRGIRQ